MGRRYIIQLLPDAQAAEHLQQIRLQLTEIVGHNKALEYPIPHITLIYSIENKVDNLPLPTADMIATLCTESRLIAPINLQASLLKDPTAHITLAIERTESLTSMRKHLYKQIAILAKSYWSSGVEDIREETWPHVTLSQQIDVAKQKEAIASLQARGDWMLPTTIRFDRIGLLMKNADAGESYALLVEAPLGG